MTLAEKVRQLLSSAIPREVTQWSDQGRRLSIPVIPGIRVHLSLSHLRDETNGSQEIQG